MSYVRSSALSSCLTGVAETKHSGKEQTGPGGAGTAAPTACRPRTRLLRDGPAGDGTRVSTHLENAPVDDRMQNPVPTCGDATLVRLMYTEAAWRRQQHVVSFVFQPGFSIRSRFVPLPAFPAQLLAGSRFSRRANHPAVHSLISDANCSGSHAKTTYRVEELTCVQLQVSEFDPMITS
jgi:hypothetical protein